MLIKPKLRILDDFGQGEYGAPRGDRKHRGNDWTCLPGSEITTLKGGNVTKLGYCYSGNLNFRYVEVATHIGGRGQVFCRYMYVEPMVKVGDWVNSLDVIGHCQDIASHHEGDTGKHMDNHVHVETFTIVDGKRKYFDSRDY